MLILGIDTCCMAATAAILSDDRLVAQTVVNNKKTHSQNIMPMIDFILKSADISISDIDCVAAAIGPGSFTGVRIGVATAKALAHASQKPCAPVSSLRALANNVVPFNGLVCPILDARRNQVYTALFQGATGERLEDDKAMALTELLDDLKSRNQNIMFVGDGLFSFGDEINKALKNRAFFAQRMQRMNLGASVAEIGYEKMLLGDTCSYEELNPVYLRLSQAERERLEKTKGGNINE